MEIGDREQIRDNLFKDIGVTCLRCGHEWLRRTGRPKKCPKCRSAYWDTPRKNRQGMRPGFGVVGRKTVGEITIDFVGPKRGDNDEV